MVNSPVLRIARLEHEKAALLEALEAVTTDLVHKFIEQGYAMEIVIEDWAVKKARAAIALAKGDHT